MSSTVNVFVHAIRTRSKKCLAQKVARFGSLEWIPMIQAPLDSSWVALQHEIGTKFLYRAAPKIQAGKNCVKFTFLHMQTWQNTLPVHTQNNIQIQDRTISWAFLRYQKLFWLLLPSQPAFSIHLSPPLARITDLVKYSVILALYLDLYEVRRHLAELKLAPVLCVWGEKERERWVSHVQVVNPAITNHS